MKDADFIPVVVIDEEIFATLIETLEELSEYLEKISLGLKNKSDSLNVYIAADNINHIIETLEKFS